jgi:hypothetical protein
MKIASTTMVAAVALWGVVQMRDVAAAETCETNYYTLDVAYMSTTEAGMTQFRTVLDPAVGAKCYSELSTPTQGHTGCMYPLATGGVPPPMPEMLGFFAGLSATTPATGGKSPITITGIKTEITCKPPAVGGCIVKTCSLGTMSVPNCRACGQ